MIAMPESAGQSARRDNYYSQTRRPLNSLAMVLPLMLFFQIGAHYCGTDLLLLAPQYLKDVLEYFGAVVVDYFPPACVVVILLIQHLAHREPWRVQPRAVAGMVGESILWTVPLIAVSYVTGRMVAGTLPQTAPAHEALQKILTSFGAGIYEEFLFRMVLLTLVMLLLVDVLGLSRELSAVAAVLAAAVLFSLCHFQFMHGAYEFRWNTFIFLGVAGTLWGAVFLFRGFGVAVGSHILRNIYARFFAG